MNKKITLKQKLYEIYSQNLSWVKEYSNVSFQPDFNNGYICPLCFNLFSSDSLSDSCLNPLTFDHNPPKSLGGKHGMLKCKQCNSKTGYKLDSHLLTRLEELDFLSFKPNSKARTILESDSNRVTADFSFDEKEKITINIDRKNSNPFQVDNFLANKSYNYKAYDPFLEGHGFYEFGTNWQLNFSMKFQSKSMERFAEIALLKIAYLYAFQKFGHGFLISSSLYPIREQILNPEKQIIKEPFWIKCDFPEKAVGLNVIKEPKELQCFLIIFNLSINNSRQQFAIALPGPDLKNLEIYSNIASILCQNIRGATSLKLEHLFDKEYVKEKKWTFAAYQYWNTFTKT